MRYDPFDADTPTDPYPTYEWLRDEAPVHYTATTDTYVLSRYDDVTWAIGDGDLFSSDAMRGVLMGQPTGVGEARLPRADAMGVLVSIDAPGHSELRRIVNRGFTPRHITSWRDRIDELVTGMLDGIAPGDALDIVGRVAAPLPVRVIAELLGADASQATAFKAWADSLTRTMSGSARAGEPDAEVLTAISGLFTHISTAIGERERQPRDDLLTTLVRAKGDDVLAPEEAVGFGGLLLFAGAETTTNLIGNACWALLQHPDELRLTVDDHSRVTAVLEETLRWEAPVQYVFRRATRPFERHGVEVPVDAIVTLVLAAANRDPRHWGDDADRFDIVRPPGAHVSFGFGPHFCLGAALARAEAVAAMEHLLPLLDGCELAGGGDDYIDSLQFRGRRRLEILTKERV
ncbi:MAG: cytochrome P450 [Acidimicrobiales bacterium]